ncbi:MAG: hypothetical protein C0475_06245 [Planctomyces sp.]|nr:hypothetical protein [Planctomyces sp.]MBA4120280.1 hypothetical protein [Isosphaera sp.]
MQRAHSGGTRARAFTIVELLSVFIIIGIVIGILLPVFQGVRQNARRVSSQNLLSTLSNATDRFIADARRAPGLFAPDEMGSNANLSQGLTNMGNVLLDLTGGITLRQAGTLSSCEDAGGVDVIGVGPRSGLLRNVAQSELGRGSGTSGSARTLYFSPDDGSLVRFCQQTQKDSDSPANRALPDLVDTFGNPVIAWVRDPRATDADPFAARVSDGGVARFYWAGNAPHLRAQSLGRSQQDQTVLSMLRDSAAAGQTDQSLIETLAGLLGNPAFPSNTRVNNRQVPALDRGSLVYHSAGADGVFLNRDDRGGRSAGAGTGTASPQPLFYEPQRDVTLDFDDILTPSGQG